MALKEFYTCYSINLMRFLKAHGFSYISRGVNDRTGRTFWVFEVTPKLSEALTNWSKNSKKGKEDQDAKGNE
jgi:hypothetical protein